MTEAEDTEDMAEVGRSLMDAIESVTRDGPLKGWSPADNPAEIVVDLLNLLDDATRWRRPETAPKTGELLLLLVRPTEHPTEDAALCRTVGSNSLEADGEDVWTFAGWCWSHDHYTGGAGAVEGWLPLADLPA